MKLENLTLIDDRTTDYSKCDWTNGQLLKKLNEQHNLIVELYYKLKVLEVKDKALKKALKYMS